MSALVPSVNTVTMTSLELVDFINNQRKPGEAELLHKSFLAKVPQVLGEETSAKFLADLPDSYGRPRKGYRFPKREACLMAMSYSYELQAKVFDRMTALESAPALPVTYADALRQLASEVEAKAAAEEQARIAVATKAEIGSRREATAMNTASQATRRANALEIELDKSKHYATVKRMELIHHGVSFNWRLLKSTSAEMGLPAVDVFDQNYGTVKAYHADVWREAYALSINPVGVA